MLAHLWVDNWLSKTSLLPYMRFDLALSRLRPHRQSPHLLDRSVALLIVPMFQALVVGGGLAFRLSCIQMNNDDGRLAHSIREHLQMT